MKVKAVQGYIMAFSFMTYYKQEHSNIGDLSPINLHLEAMMNKYKRKGLDFKAHLKKGWKFFEDYNNDEEKGASVVAFILQLILKNPDKNKNKALTNLAMDLNSKELFSKDELITNSKIFVNRFYGLIKD